MQAQGLVRKLRTLLIGVSPVVVAACGGNASIGAVGSSSGGGSTTLQGTFFGYTGNSQRSFPSSTQQDTIFGVVASDGSGFFADTQSSGRQAIFSMGTASSTGSSSVTGFFTAYAASGSNLGDGTLIATSTSGLTGTLSSTSSGTQAALNYAFPDGYSNAANIVLDNPALSKTAIAAATYAAGSSIGGSAAVATSAISTNAADVYTLSFNSSTSFTLSSAGGCNFTSNSATADANVNVYLLSGVSGSCPGTGTITLSGLASYLPKGGHSPLGGALANNAVVLELDDSESGSTPKYALSLVAIQQ